MLDKVERVEAVDIVTVSRRIPYNVIKEEIEGTSSDILSEIREISKYYEIYRKGSKFQPEGTSGDYIASNVRFRKAAQLINKEARFLFGETPDITVVPVGDGDITSDEYKASLSSYQSLVNNVLYKNKFQKFLLQAAKDCFIGKRVACIVNFNEETGITVTFLDAFSFIYERDPNEPNKLVKLVAFTVLNDSSSLKEKRVMKKKYVLEDDGRVYAEDTVYDGRGKELEKPFPYQATELKNIPGFVVLNDGLLSDEKGESEISQLEQLESTFSKLSNADVDAERKGMNQVKYTIDMDSDSTKKLSTSPGSYWDLQRNMNLENASPSVGTLQSSMEYSSALDTTLKRFKKEMFDTLEMPDIDLETMSGIVTSGKALKAIYWPLIVRCKEKMKEWGPQLQYVIGCIIEGAIAYPNIAKKYVTDSLIPIEYAVKVVQNFPLPEDEQEEKNMDLAEVTAQTMSRKFYMKKWRELTDKEADAELEQIALERQMLEESYQDNTFGM